MTADTPQAGDVFVRTYRGLEGEHDLPTHDVILVTRADPDGVVVWQELNFYTHALPKCIILRDVPGRMLRNLTGLNGIPLSRTAEGTPGDWYDALADWYDAMSDYAAAVFKEARE